MKLALFLTALALALAAGAESGEKELVQGRKKRFSIFHVVQFPNTQCVLAMSTPNNVMMGTCYTQSECATSGGTVSGNCASGFGVCCMVLVSTCGSTVSRNCTYIQNPGFPTSFTTTGAGSCSYNFAANADICQIRLDFSNFVVSQPVNVNALNLGQCVADQFTVTSSTTAGTLGAPNPPVLCGTNTGQHMYFETGRSTNAGSILFNFAAGTPNQIRTWKIKVTFLECGNPNRAPTDCTQYYTGVTGNLQSYNFDNANGQFLMPQNYVACIRQEEGFCSVAYSEDDVLSAQGKSFLLGTNMGTQSTRSCTNLGILIPTVAFDNTMMANNFESFCGIYLNPLNAQVNSGTVLGTIAPFNVGVFSSSSIMPGPSKGFLLKYAQVPC